LPRWILRWSQRARRQPTELRFTSRSIRGWRAPTTRLAITDINGDGKLDLVTTSFQSNAISVLLGNGDATFQPAADYPVVGRSRRRS
jgi:hypothetical protein